MLKKVFLQTQFGSPHPWTEQYFENFKMLEEFGWHLMVFTPNPWKSHANIEIVKMDLQTFDDLIGVTCGVKPGNFLTEKRVPSKVVSDYYPAYGQILQAFIREFDYWGFTNWDVVYGRLDRFLPDAELSKFDIWADEGTVAINGIFTMFRNDERINNLFRQVPNWEATFVDHRPCGFDEIQMSECVKKLAAADEIRFGHPRHFGFHSFDRLPQHQPNPNLYFEADGALIEKYDDYAHPPARVRHSGREVMMFHFSRTKRYPQVDRVTA